jgi:Fe2+ transport system protein FeoA
MKKNSKNKEVITALQLQGASLIESRLRDCGVNADVVVTVTERKPTKFDKLYAEVKALEMSKFCNVTLTGKEYCRFDVDRSGKTNKRDFDAICEIAAKYEGAKVHCCAHAAHSSAIVIEFENDYILIF